MYDTNISSDRIDGYATVTLHGPWYDEPLRQSKSVLKLCVRMIKVLSAVVALSPACLLEPTTYRRSKFSFLFNDAVSALSYIT